MKKLNLINILVIFSMSGCNCIPTTTQYAEQVQISNDGKFIAFLWDEEKWIGLGPEPVAIQQSVSICWATVDNTDKLQNLKVAKWGSGKADYSLQAQTHFLFSPDSKHLAVVCPERIVFINLSTNESWDKSLKGEMISSLCWLDESSVGYVSYLLSGKQAGHRTFWRQGLHETQEKRISIYQDSGDTQICSQISLFSYDTYVDWPQEYWSPDGRYVLFQGPPETTQSQLLEVKTGKVSLLGNPSESFRLASWSPNSSQVVWTNYNSSAEKYNTYILNVLLGKQVDISKGFHQTFGSSMPDYDPLWTPDNEFLVGSNLDLGGYLIKPQPWEIRYIVKEIEKNLKINNAAIPPYIRRQPYPGILIAELSPGEALVDYEGKIIEKLNTEGVFGWTCLPSGNEVISVQIDNSIVIKNIKNRGN